MENDRAGQEEPVGGDLAAVPRARAIGSSPATRSVTRSRAASAWPRAKRSAPSSRRSRLRRPETTGDGGTAAETGVASGVSRTPQELLAAVRTLRARWQQEIAARGVDRERAAALDQRFAAAFARVLAAVPRRLPAAISIPTRIASAWKRSCGGWRSSPDSAAPSGGAAGDAALSPTTRLAAMLKEALAANTIGGKVDEESRMRAAAEEVRQAQASWARIGPVPDDVRRALADRFARACRRITEKAGAAGAAGRREGQEGQDGWKVAGPGRPKAVP